MYACKSLPTVTYRLNEAKQPVCVGLIVFLQRHNDFTVGFTTEAYAVCFLSTALQSLLFKGKNTTFSGKADVFPL